MSRLREHEFQGEEVMAYLDGELEPKRAAALASHLEHCIECQTLARNFRQISERMLDFQVDGMPERIGDAVRTAVDETRTIPKVETDVPRLARDWRRILVTPHSVALACAAVVVVIALVLWLNSPDRATVDKISRAETTNTGLMGIASSRQANGLSTIAPKSMPSSLPMNQKDASVPDMSLSFVGPNQGTESLGQQAVPQGPMIVRTASLTVVSANYDTARTALESLATGHGGYVQNLTALGQTSSSRSTSATLRVPAQQLDGLLSDLRKLGHVEQESQANTEVTDQYVDLDARLKNARATEQRLIDLLATRTGKLEDVLDVERELERVRGDVESMDAQRSSLLHRVDYAMVSVDLREQYQEKLGSDSYGAGTKMWNALVEGFGNLSTGFVGLITFLLAYGPSILFWSLLILTPGWFIWRKYRASVS